VHPKLAIDARWYRTGLGRYTQQLLAGLKQFANTVAIEAIVTPTSAPYAAALCDCLRVVKASGYSLREQWEMPRAARGCDLLHIPHYNAPLFFSGPLVITIHDLLHISHEGHQGRRSVWLYAQAMLRLASAKAAHIITVSEYTKQQIIETLGIDGTNITAIPHGVDTSFQKIDREAAGHRVNSALRLARKYFVCVSSLRPHKNLLRLIEASALFWRKTRMAWDLVIVGDGRPNQRRALLAECERLRIRDRVHLV